MCLPTNVSPTSRTRCADRSRCRRICAPHRAARRHPAAAGPRGESSSGGIAPPAARGAVAWFLAGARSQPLALAFEDLHWADPTSLDLMQALAERGAQAPMLILATARPEFRPPWSLRSHHSVISLSPLDRADVARWSANSPLAMRWQRGGRGRERTHRRCAAVHRGGHAPSSRARRGRRPQAIPPTLQQSLAARLDRLGEAREIAQIGAVLGRDFSYALLALSAAIDDRALQSALDRLAEADLLIVEGARLRRPIASSTR